MQFFTKIVYNSFVIHQKRKQTKTTYGFVVLLDTFRCKKNNK